jgi:hypothetical protein
MWAVLHRFGGYPHLQQDLAGDKINNLQNCMTLCVAVHTHWDRLRIWLEPIEEVSEYDYTI